MTGPFAWPLWPSQSRSASTRGGLKAAKTSALGVAEVLVVSLVGGIVERVAGAASQIIRLRQLALRFVLPFLLICALQALIGEFLVCVNNWRLRVSQLFEDDPQAPWYLLV